MQMVNKVLERDLEAHYSKECRRLRLLTVKFVGISQRGWPDRLILHKGRAYFSELKTLHGVQSPLQKLVSSKIQAAGFEVPILRTKTEITQYLEHISGSQ